MKRQFFSLLLCALLLCQPFFLSGCTNHTDNKPDENPSITDTDNHQPGEGTTLDKKALKSFVIVAQDQASDHVLALAKAVKNACGKTPDILKPAEFSEGNAFLIGDYVSNYSGRRYGIVTREESNGTQILLFGADKTHQALAVEALLRDFPISEQSAFPEQKFYYEWQEEDGFNGIVETSSNEAQICEGITYIKKSYTRADGKNLDAYVAIVSPALAPYITVSAPTLGTVQTTSAQASKARENGQNVQFAVNAGFFDMNKTNYPTGGCIAGGTVLREPEVGTTHSNYWFGVTREGKPIIADAGSYYRLYQNNIDHLVCGYKKIFTARKIEPLRTDLNPLTTVGICADGSVVFVCTDGRTAQSAGSAYADIAYIYMETGLDITDVLVLDGGGSTTVVADKNGELTVKNNPSDGSERKVQSVIFVSIP